MLIGPSADAGRPVAGGGHIGLFHISESGHHVDDPVIGVTEVVDGDALGVSTRGTGGYRSR